MPSFKPPQQFNFREPQGWPEWRSQFQHFRIASELTDKSGEVHVSSLIYSMGPCRSREDFHSVWITVGMTISEGRSLETVVFEEGYSKPFPSWWFSISGLYFTCPLNTEIIMKRHGRILCVMLVLMAWADSTLPTIGGMAPKGAPYIAHMGCTWGNVRVPSSIYIYEVLIIYMIFCKYYFLAKACHYTTRNNAFTVYCYSYYILIIM